MKLFTRRPVDPTAAADAARARVVQTKAEVESARIVAEGQRRQREAAERERRQRRAQRRAAWSDRWGKARTVLPLLLINGGAAYSQAAYAYTDVAPALWNAASRVAFALAFAVALESIAVYVQWHAHDALMHHAHATAARLRRASWGIAAIIAGINYAHWSGAGLVPTPPAVAFGLLSLLSPWLWGLHTRRAQHVQLLAESPELIDRAGAQFSPARWRAFPLRTWRARRWSIDYGVCNPQAAWDGYRAERERRSAARPVGRWRAAVAAWRGRPAAGVVVKPVPVPDTEAPAEPVRRTGGVTSRRAGGKAPSSKAGKATAGGKVTAREAMHTEFLKITAAGGEPTARDLRGAAKVATGKDPGGNRARDLLAKWQAPAVLAEAEAALGGRDG